MKKLINEMLDNSHDMIFILRLKDGYVDYVNQTVIESLGYSLEEINTLGIESFRRALKEGEPFFEHLEELKRKGKLIDYAILTRKDGSQFPVEANLKFVKKDGQDYNIAIVRDITERFELEKKLRELNKNLECAVEEQTKELLKNIAYLKSYKLVMDESSIVSRADIYGNITYVNDNFCEVSGYTREEVLGKPHNIIRNPHTSSEIFRELWETIKAKKVWKGILQNSGKKESYWVDITILPILDESEDIVEFIAVRHDITKIIEQKKALDEIVYKDILTGFGNRNKLNTDIQNSANPALALINIDDFSIFNDFYGHAIGDTILISFGNLIAQNNGNNFFNLYRLQGDEFALLCDSCSREDFLIHLERLIQNIKSIPILLDDEIIQPNITTAISFENPLILLQTADMAFKVAKLENKNMVIYSEDISLNDTYKNNILWSKKIKKALLEDRIVPYFQPIVNNKNQKFEKYETLVRLIEEDGQVISPYFFLDISKKTKQYESITKVMIEKSFEYFKDKNCEFSLNLTIEDIVNEEVNSFLFESLKNYGIGSFVVFEIVESESIQNFEVVIGFIQKLKSFGCKIAIDDFGSGYSNFAYILKLHVDYLKIDGSLIKNITTDKNSKIVVSTIAEFAKKLGIKTIAEFVENEAIFKVMQELEIDYSQGYYFQAPQKNTPSNKEKR